VNKRRTTRQRNKVWENLPLSNGVKKRYDVYTTISYLRRLPTYDTAEEHEKGFIYYHVPCYGYVKLDDLNDLHCNDYKSKSAILLFIDSIKHSESPVIELRWNIIA
jgi:hypothetical protein